MTTPRILIVDDDREIRELVGGLVERNHMKAVLAPDVPEAERAMAEGRVDLVVLDIMMPGEDGTSFCRRLRQDSDIPIIMLTALGEDVDRIVGLEMGADDYLPKPFNPRELIARIKNILRRAPPSQPGEVGEAGFCYLFDRYRLDPETRSLRTQAGEEVMLTSGEFTLLVTLIERAPRVLNRDQLLDLSRGAAANPFDRSIDAQISRIRRKLEADPRRPSLIKTVRNLGYAFAAKIEKAER
jgi:DNA-binding response OmpR family regulator